MSDRYADGQKDGWDGTGQDWTVHKERTGQDRTGEGEGFMMIYDDI